MTAPVKRPFFFFLLSLLIVFGTRAQQNSSFDLIYGNALYRKDFLGQLNHPGLYELGRPMQYVGFGGSGYLVVNRGDFQLTELMGAQYIPQAFAVNDSVTGRISGCFFGAMSGWHCFPKSSKLDLSFNAGLNVGRLKLVQSKGHVLETHDNILHLKNMLICPKAAVMMKFFLGKTCLSLKGELLVDISGSQWKEKLLAFRKPDSVPVPGFNQTALNFSIMIGLPDYAYPAVNR